MSYKTFEISIPADEDGYVTFQCPYCNQRFKLNASEIQDSDGVDI
jgi:redox-regulated HSP33 family molecular chaperone